ncbi:MAG TPA: cyclase family protein [Pyrinomonadaceae bacterium]|jgi:kynurenine formamidase
MNFDNFRIIDLSVPLAPCPSENVPVEIQYMDHRFGGAHLAQLVNIEQESLCDGLGWASERVTAITHSGTHVDSPFHYSPVCAGEPSRTIDEMPLDWFWGAGVCITVDDKPQSRSIGVDEVEAFERQHDYRIKPGDIVLFRTGAGSRYGSPDYNRHGRGISPELIEMLCLKGVRVFGTDAWSIDPPYWLMQENISKHGTGAVWEAHFAGRQREFCVIEKLSNLDKLPPAGFWVSCFPIKVKRGSGGWTRAVAFLNRQ